MASGNPSNAAYPQALDPLTPKVTADNGGDFSALLQPEHQRAFRADATDAATTMALANGLKADLIALGLMKAS